MSVILWFAPTPPSCSHPPVLCLVCQICALRGMGSLTHFSLSLSRTQQDGGADEVVSLHLQPARLEVPPQMDCVDPMTQIQGIAADTCCARSQVVTKPCGLCTDLRPGSHHHAALEREDTKGRPTERKPRRPGSSLHPLTMSYIPEQQVITDV